MLDIPSDSKCEKCADYLIDNYVTTKSKFPPHLWAEVPSDYKRTSNGPVSFHAHFNEQFYFGHPGIYTFLDVLLYRKCKLHQIYELTCSSVKS